MLPDNGYTLSKQAVQKIAKAVREVRGGVGTPSRRPTPTRRRDRSTSSSRPDMAYCQVASYDATNDVITTKDSPLPVALPTGTPVITGAIKVFDRDGVGFSADDYFYAIKQYNVHTDGTHGQVDWVVLPTAAATPLRQVTIDKGHSSQSAGDPVTTVLPRIFSGKLTTTGDIWIEILDDQEPDRFWMPALAVLIGVANGVYDPDPGGGSTDERPLYVAMPVERGDMVGFVSTAFTAADLSDLMAPTFGTGVVTTWMQENDLDIVQDTTYTCINILEETIALGTICKVSRCEFGLIVEPSCQVASGYSEA